MPETPDPDPLAKLRGILRNAADELARLADHPTVTTLLGGLRSAFAREHPPARPPGRAPSTAAAPTEPGPQKQPDEPPTKRPASAEPAGTAKSRPRAGGRREELLAIIEERPGVSVAAAAKQIGVAPGGLYRVARKLESDGMIRKEGTGWHRVGSAS